ncbi:MAG: PLP-dependent aspartate aminotransferase family protein [Gammaproteobacteria bacterium]|nr:PLP-dependent aspartate aminotransferase family protein [Gammaproteobacteria bacterium]
MHKSSRSDHRLETRAVHGGEQVDDLTGASAPNIVMSSTFVLDDPAGFSIKEFEEDRPYVYTRWGNPTIEMLEKKLMSLEEAEHCIALASGMAATTTLLLGLLKSGDHLVISDVCYPGTAEYVRDTLPKYGIQSTPVDTSEVELVSDAIQPNTKLVWIETPANPILRLTDIAAVAKVAHEHGLPLVVDSTFATPVATRPLTFGADYVIHSLTKYIGGHGDSIGGAILGSRERIEVLRNDAMIHLGGIISPFNAWLIARGAATLPARMRMHADSAMQVAKFLEGHPAVLRVNYPGLSSHPQHSLAKQQMDCYSGMLSFQAKNGKALAQRFARDLEVFHFAVSLGHSRSLLYWVPTEETLSTGLSLNSEQTARYRDFAGDGLFRASVGLEHPEDLCEDLARVLGN